MEKRIGNLLILLNDKHAAAKVNAVLSEHADIILGRQGLPNHARNINIISIILEGSVEAINSLSGSLGRIKEVQVKAVMAKPQMQ